MVFMHAHRNGWHVDVNKSSNVLSAQQLRLEWVQLNGYANLLCSRGPGCPSVVRPWKQPKKGAVVPPPNARNFTKMYSEAWTFGFGVDEPMPPKVGGACCAQFAVSKAQVLKRGKQDYVNFRKWLWETKYKSKDSGRVMEYIWHILFGQDAV